MRLFSPQETQEREQKKEAEKMSKILELDNMKSKLMKEVSGLEQAKKDLLAKWEKEHKAYVEQKEAEARRLQNEVTALERRREEAMRPIDELKEEARNILKSAEAKQVELEKREAELDEIREEVAQLEKEAKENVKQRSFELMQAKADRDEARRGREMILKLILDMNKRIAQFEKVMTETNETQERERAELKINASALRDKEENLKQREQKIKGDLRKIKSEQAALAAAKREIYGRS